MLVIFPGGIHVNQGLQYPRGTPIWKRGTCLSSFLGVYMWIKDSSTPGGLLYEKEGHACHLSRGIHVHVNQGFQYPRGTPIWKGVACLSSFLGVYMWIKDSRTPGGLLYEKEEHACHLSWGYTCESRIPVLLRCWWRNSTVLREKYIFL